MSKAMIYCILFVVYKHTRIIKNGINIFIVILNLRIFGLSFCHEAFIDDFVDIVTASETYFCKSGQT